MQPRTSFLVLAVAVFTSVSFLGPGCGSPPEQRITERRDATGERRTQGQMLSSGRTAREQEPSRAAEPAARAVPPSPERAAADAERVAREAATVRTLEAEIDRLSRTEDAGEAAYQLLFLGYEQEDALGSIPRRDRNRLLVRARKAGEAQYEVFIEPYRLRADEFEPTIEGAIRLAERIDAFRATSEVVRHPVAARIREQVSEANQEIRFAVLTEAYNHVADTVRAKVAELPNMTSPANDRLVMRLCEELVELDRAIFPVQDMTMTANMYRIRQGLHLTSSRLADRLPPRVRAEYRGVNHRDWSDEERSRFMGSGVPDPSGAAAERPVDDIQWAYGRSFSRGDDASRLPAIALDPRHEFDTNICWALFHGRFDELNPRLYGNDPTTLGRNPLLDYVFITYAGLTSIFYGENGIGPSVRVGWRTYNEGGEPVGDLERVVYIPIGLSDHYERAYKLATAYSAMSNISHGAQPFNGEEALLGLMQTMANFAEWRLPTMQLRPDGSLGIAADWEAVYTDELAKFIDAWPPRAAAVWQFQENLVRYYEGRPSLQQATGAFD
ncbi:MAG: hypothetical protein AAGF47_00540 [Planctomycetota bacterium]